MTLKVTITEKYPRIPRELVADPLAFVEHTLRNTVPHNCRNFILTFYSSVVTTCNRLRLKCVGTRAEIIFRLSAKRTSPFKSAGASVQSTTGSRGVCISGSNAGYTMFRSSVRSTGYPLHSPVSPSLPLPSLTVFHHISA